jgi:hypothetical protein
MHTLLQRLSTGAHPVGCAALLLAAALGATVSLAQEPPARSCSDPAFRQLDFWVGDWDLRWRNADGSESSGRNVISRDEFGDCVIYERFSAEGFNGMSVSTYHQPTGTWRQTWVDDSGGYFALTGGPVNDGSVRFVLQNTRLSDEETQLRMIWEQVTADRLVWRWQSLPADADPERDAWADRWVIRYQRSD